MMLSRMLYTMAVDMGIRPSEIASGGHAAASFDAQVWVKAKAE
jgi:hypothetical protein